MIFPDIPEQYRSQLPDFFWNWYRDLKKLIRREFTTAGDVTLIKAGDGIILTNAAGTVTKRVRLNDLGDGLLFEDP